MRVSTNSVRNMVNAGNSEAEITPLGRLIDYNDLLRVKAAREAKANRQPPARRPDRKGLVMALIIPATLPTSAGPRHIVATEPVAVYRTVHGPALFFTVYARLNVGATGQCLGVSVTAPVDLYFHPECAMKAAATFQEEAAGVLDGPSTPAERNISKIDEPEAKRHDGPPRDRPNVPTDTLNRLCRATENGPRQ